MFQEQVGFYFKEVFSIPPNIQTFQLCLKASKHNHKSWKLVTCIHSEALAFSGVPSIQCLAMKRSMGKASCQLYSMSVLCCLWEESSAPDKPGAFTPKNSEETSWAQSDQQISLQHSTGAQGEEQSWRLKMTWGKKQLHCWFVLWKFLPPRFPACWSPAPDLVNWHIMRLSFITGDKNQNSFAWVKDKPL